MESSSSESDSSEDKELDREGAVQRESLLYDLEKILATQKMSCHRKSKLPRKRSQPIGGRRCVLKENWKPWPRHWTTLTRTDTFKKTSRRR